MIEINFDSGNPEGECVVMEGGEVIARFTGPKRGSNMMLFADMHGAWSGFKWLGENPSWRLDNTPGSMRLTHSGVSIEVSAYGHPVITIIGKLAEAVRDAVAKREAVQP